jgi:hypothetical protein
MCCVDNDDDICHLFFNKMQKNTFIYYSFFCLPSLQMCWLIMIIVNLIWGERGLYIVNKEATGNSW